MNPLRESLSGGIGRGSLAALLLLPLSHGVSADEWYLRAGVAHNFSTQATFLDRQCASTQPPALFGCGAGSDGNDLHADGRFAASNALSLGVGKRLSPYWRAEIDLVHQAGTTYGGRANFRNVPGEQDVSGKLSSQAVFVNAYFDLLGGAQASFGVLQPGLWPSLQPYIGLGVGYARNHVDAMRYAFPGLSASAATLTPAGTHGNAAWRFVLGTGLRINQQMTLDLAWQYQDMGKVETAAGEATIIRSSTRGIQIDGTRAPWRSQGISIALRYAF